MTGRGAIIQLHNHFIKCISQLGKLLKLKQRVIATAITYYKRTFTRTSFESLDPRLVVPTVVYLAGKVEECGVRAGDVVSSLARLRQRFHILANIRTEHLLECEFYVLQQLDFDLIVHHPYSCLVRYVADMQQEDDTVADTCMQTAWNMINDSFYTDIPLLYPPFMVAVAAIVMSCITKGRQVEPWLQALNINDEILRSVSKTLLQFYDNPPLLDKASTAPLVRILEEVVPKLGQPSSAFAVASDPGAITRTRSSSSVGIPIAGKEASNRTKNNRQHKNGAEELE